MRRRNVFPVARKIVSDAGARELDHELATQLHPDLLQLGAKIVPTSGRTNTPSTKEALVAKQITCECGQVVRGTTRAR
jgi:hypothetical protein